MLVVSLKIRFVKTLHHYWECGDPGSGQAVIPQQDVSFFFLVNCESLIPVIVSAPRGRGSIPRQRTLSSSVQPRRFEDHWVWSSDIEGTEDFVAFNLMPMTWGLAAREVGDNDDITHGTLERAFARNLTTFSNNQLFVGPGQVMNLLSHWSCQLSNNSQRCPICTIYITISYAHRKWPVWTICIGLSFPYIWSFQLYLKFY